MEFAFVSGSPALDLAATVGSRRSDPVDLLATPEDLKRWLTACDGIPTNITVDRPGFESAMELREAVYQLSLDRVQGRPFTPDALSTINAAAAAPDPTLALSDSGLRLSGGLRATLSYLARRGIAVLADPHARLKECGRADCTRIYLDRSRGARRTWCGMDECGNRVKAAAYRARKRSATG